MRWVAVMMAGAIGCVGVTPYDQLLVMRRNQTAEEVGCARVDVKITDMEDNWRSPWKATCGDRRYACEGKVYTSGWTRYLITCAVDAGPGGTPTPAPR